MSLSSKEFNLQADYCLHKLNSLALPARAEYFCSVDSLDQLHQALDYANLHQLAVTPLGEGSNIVLAGDIKGLVIDLNLKGIQNKNKGSDKVQVDMAAGENWHHMVEFCLRKGWYGLENLALIPGTVGAAPIQNIGAYGVELSDFFVSLEAVEVKTGKLVKFSAQDCQFDYRSSIFKRAALDQYIIISLSLELSTIPVAHTEYPALNTALKGTEPSPEAVFKAVCRIRREKLPDPVQIPNVGSFFKNPLVSSSLADKLSATFPTIPCYPQADGLSKIPAAWLIEQCGYKGQRHGNVGVHAKQALVLVNFEGEGTELLALAQAIEADVNTKFGIQLDIEPRVYGHHT
jgi:UDP-N-acetylmuramate dehydrogenase